MWLFISWVNLERIAGQLFVTAHAPGLLFVYSCFSLLYFASLPHPPTLSWGLKMVSISFPLCRQCVVFWGGPVARLPWLLHVSHLICCMAPTLQWSIDELILFVCFQFIMTAVSVSLPIPAGVFFPVFLIGKTKLIHLRLSNIWQFGLMQSRG